MNKAIAEGWTTNRTLIDSNEFYIVRPKNDPANIKSASSDADAYSKITKANANGKVVEPKMGQTTSHVKLDIGGGHIVTVSITNEAVDKLNLKVGDQAWAVMKASDVMMAQEA
ncbi:TOBE domain-containing protein [Polynucleobacter necessarius]|uniref:TOBE domain-containing protein n=1 Tax=Polynucleobacter necessarius TaxID=576610 RepID=UPI001E329344|nr:TOBE domain-containing protein [Polynucleobacter necessarius]